MVRSFDETLNAAERAVATVKAWTASERKQFELGRLAGIREAIELLETEYELIIIPKALRAKLLPPPSVGEKAECTTCGATDPLATPTCSNGFHAPKPAAEKP